jgi:hypothetical protein
VPRRISVVLGVAGGTQNLAFELGTVPAGAILGDGSVGRQIQPECLVDIIGVAKLLVSTGTAKSVLGDRIDTIVDQLLAHCSPSL